MDTHKEGKRRTRFSLWQVGLLVAAFLAGLSVSRLILATQTQANCPAPNSCSG